MKLSKSVVVMLFVGFFTAIGQIFWKLGVNKLESELVTSLTFVFIGFAIYGISGILMIKSLSDNHLSVLQPMLASGYIWAGILAPIYIGGEIMNVYNWFGVVLIIGGIIFLSQNGK